MYQINVLFNKNPAKKLLKFDSFLWTRPYVQMETINEHHAILFISYIEVTYMNLHTTQNTAHGF